MLGGGIGNFLIRGPLGFSIAIAITGAVFMIYGAKSFR